jgi:superfamily II DNA or RNA helicase
MNINPDQIEKILRRTVGVTIYQRGVDYWKKGRVRNLQIIEPTSSKEIVRLAGNVLGSFVYNTTAVYNLKSEEFTDLTCSCPYEIDCKHAVALVLEYTKSIRETDTKKSATYSNVSKDIKEEKENEVRTELRQLGFNDNLLPDSVIQNLVKQKLTSLTHNKNKITNNISASNTSVFDPSEFMVILNASRGYSPSFHRKGNYNQEARIAPLLAKSNITEADKKLLSYLKDYNRSTSYYSLPEVDLKILFPLLLNSQFTVLCGDGYYYNTNPRPITLRIDPPAICLQVLYTKVPHPYAPEAINPRSVISVILREDREEVNQARFSNKRWRPPFIKVNSVLLRETDKELFLYQPSTRWVNILARMHENYSQTSSQKEEFLDVGTNLEFDEIDTFHTLIEETGEQISLSVDGAMRNFIPVQQEPRQLLEINFNANERCLQIMPYLDYGLWRSELTTRISRRYQGPIRYAIRSVYEHDDDYVLIEDNNQLNYVRLQPLHEIEFYKLLEAHHEEIGFTKTLRCLHRGRAKIDLYLSQHWPTLLAFAQKNDITIVFTQDVLPKEKVVMTTHFTSEIEPDLDWLHFDVDLYCAGEKVSLKHLYDFMQSGETYWRKDDGTLVELENRSELERLVRLLQGFHEREAGGFEGRLHHAPELSYVMTSSPHYDTLQNKGLKIFMDKLKAGKPVKKVTLPKRVKEMLRPYQRSGVEWLYFLRSYHFAGVLADDMGLGKTIQALTMIALEKIPGTPSLVVCPKSLLFNWQKEATMFFPDLKVLVYDGSPTQRSGLRKTIVEHDLIVVSYNTLMKDHSVLCGADAHYHYAVLDEAQYIKNHLTKVAQRVKEIPADYRLALTGTPLENHVFELWSIYDYLMPGFLGKHNQFKELFHRPIMETSDPDALAHLRKKVESFMLRRIKEEVLKELPPKVEQIRECVLTDAQNVLYQQILTEVRGSVFDTVSEKGFKGSQIHILAGLTKLRQVCNHPALLTKDIDYKAYDSAKLDLCLELVEEVRQGGRKVLIFSQFTGMLDILAKAMTENEIKYSYLSGKTRKRQEVIDQFNNEPTVTAFLISMKAGGTGLNLTSADNVIVFDPWWNPSVERQAVDRAHRMGQTKSVNVYRLVTKGTIEEKIQLLKNKKQNLFDAVIEESGELFSKLTWEDVQDLFR